MIRAQVLEAFQALNILLLFVVLFFTLRYGKVNSLLELGSIDAVNRKERDRARASIIRSVRFDLMPTTILSGIAVYLLLPTAVKILKTSQFHVWHFDVLLTGYLAVILATLGLVLWSLYLARSLHEKAQKYVNDEKTDAVERKYSRKA